jgi:membrane-bound lytic murein transglycosylase A
MRGFPYFEHVSNEAVPCAALEGFSDEDHLAAFQVFAASSEAIAEAASSLRPALDPSSALIEICRKALSKPPADAKAARLFFETHFEPHRVKPDTGFLTGYYEPVVEGALAQTAEFTAPVFARPRDLVTLKQGESLNGPESPVQAARRRPRGLEPYPDRAAIESGVIDDYLIPVVWLKDKVEAFFIHVQGSARVRLRDGSELRLTYAGRNGHPYTSIGRVLIEQEKIPPQEAGMAGLKKWIREKGQNPGDAGHALMLRNKSYIFFSASDVLHPQKGPIGGQGISLTPLRSIAVDRGIWAYGLPMWIEAELPWRSSSPEKFRRLLIAQDTGSAITGAARGDLFFGSGDEAGALAGALRHSAAFTVFLPRDVTKPS